MPSPVINYFEFDPALLNFDDVYKNKRGGKMVFLSYGPEKRRVFVQTPPNLPVPFGLNEFKDDKGGGSYSVSVSFRNAGKDPRVERSYNKMKELDEAIIAAAVQNSPEWLGRAMDKSVVAELYRPLIKPPSDPMYSPTMRVKIPIQNGVPKCEVYGEDKEVVDVGVIVKGSTLRMIMQLRSVWFVNKTFGVTWELVQAAASSPRTLHPRATNESDSA